MHNGCIYRWNRPVLDIGSDGIPHLRIEQRCLPGGPSMIDMFANAAFYIGLMQALAKDTNPPEHHISFVQAHDNFNAAARDGLNAELTWLNQNKINVRTLLLEELIPAAQAGLESLDIATDDIEHYLGVIKARVTNKQTGSQWQRAFINKHGKDFTALTKEYLEKQKSNIPVHEWDV